MNALNPKTTSFTAFTEPLLHGLGVWPAGSIPATVESLPTLGRLMIGLLQPHVLPCGVQEVALHGAQQDLTDIIAVVTAPMSTTPEEQIMTLQRQVRQKQEDLLTQMMQQSAALATGVVKLSELLNGLSEDRADRIKSLMSSTQDTVPTARALMILREQTVALQQENQQMLKRFKMHVTEEFPLRAVWIATIRRLQSDKRTLELENAKLNSKMQSVLDRDLMGSINGRRASLDKDVDLEISPNSSESSDAAERWEI